MTTKDPIEEQLAHAAAAVKAVPSVGESVMRELEGVEVAPRPGRLRVLWDRRRSARSLLRPARAWPAAACLLAAVIVWCVFGLGRTPSAYAELARALTTTRAAEWVHVRFLRAGKATDMEMWISFRPHRSYGKFDGKILAVQGDLNRQQLYDPADNTITIIPLDDDSLSDKATFLEAMLAGAEETARWRGAPVSKSVQTVGDVRYTVYTVTKGQADEEPLPQRIYVDPRTNRIARMVSGKAEPITCEVDYPKTGPKDIFALGVPRDAKIVDKMPTPDVLVLDRKIRAARDPFGPTYYAILCSGQLEQRPGRDEPVFVPQQVRAVYKRGGRYRIEAYLTHNLKGADAADMAGVKKWLETQSPAAISFRDGQGTGQYAMLDWATGKVRFKPERSVITQENTVEGLTWGPLWTTRAASVTKANGLLVRKHGEGQGVSYRTSVRYDPRRDYVRLRHECSMGKQKVVVTAGSLRQTPKGQWYAQEYTRTNGMAGNKDTLMIRVHLDTTREIPKELLDPKKLTPKMFMQPPPAAK